MKSKTSLLPTSTSRGSSQQHRRFSFPSGSKHARRVSSGRPQRQAQRGGPGLALASTLGFLFCCILAYVAFFHLPRYYADITFAVRDLNDLAYGGFIRPTYYKFVEAFDTCQSVGMSAVASVDGDREVQGEGQSWNHVEGASGDKCAAGGLRGPLDPEIGAAGRAGEAGGLPKVFVFEPAVNRYVPKGSRCEEQFFREVVLANETGNLVGTVDEADRIYVSFLAQCFSDGDFDVSALRRDRDREGSDHFTAKIPGRRIAKVSPFDLLWEEVGKTSPISSRLRDAFIYSERHWTKRTGFALPIRAVLRNYPFTILSPEVTNLQAEEARRKDNWRWLRRHVVVPQPPLVAWPLEDATSAEGRPHRFCFSGTQINNERRVLSEVLGERNDSSVVAGCRRDRTNLQHHLRNNKNSASMQYRSCQMCLVPHGDSLSDRRLFDALSSGCVPVVTPIMRPLPFATTPGVDYFKAVLFIKPSSDARQLRAALDKIALEVTPARLRQLRAEGARIARLLSYSECGGRSGLRLTMRQLLVQRREEEEDVAPRDLTSLLLSK